MTDQQLFDLFKAFNDGNLQAVLPHIHPEAEWQIFGDNALPILEYNKGIDNILAFFQKLAVNMDMTVNEPGIIYRSEAFPNKVLISGKCAAKVYKTNKTYNVPFVDTMTLAPNGQILKYERLMDTLQTYFAFQE